MERVSLMICLFGLFGWIGWLVGPLGPLGLFGPASRLVAWLVGLNGRLVAGRSVGRLAG